MSKRSASVALDRQDRWKRQKTACDRLSNLSDELLLRILSHLPFHDLIVCQRVSKQLYTIAGDSQLWKQAYFDRFVRARFHRPPKPSRKAAAKSQSWSTARLSKWAEEETADRDGQAINWKKQYRLRHKWSRGSCGVSQIPVSMSPPLPPLLGRLHEGVVYTVDCDAGLRAWSYKDEQKLLASVPLRDTPSLPTSIAVNSRSPNLNFQQLVVGFEDGSFSIYSYSKLTKSLLHHYTHPPSSNGLLSALAFASPYLLSMSEEQTLSLYTFQDRLEDNTPTKIFSPPRLLTSLKSHTVWAPLSLSMRTRGRHIIAAVAYCVPTVSGGWSIGVQELSLTADGELEDSRIATAAGSDSNFLSRDVVDTKFHGAAKSDDEDYLTRGQIFSKPTSISYSHPYLLTSHSDNTLSFYIVTSTADKLTVSGARRLWGHTSSVFGAHVEGRGKAVSVSTRGNEVRVWELEGSLFPKTHRFHGPEDDFSVQLSPERRASTPIRLNMVSDAIAARGSGVGLAQRKDSDDIDVTRAWVGFDEENVVVLREHEHGSQALAVYDFS